MRTSERLFWGLSICRWGGAALSLWLLGCAKSPPEGDARAPAPATKQASPSRPGPVGKREAAYERLYLSKAGVAGMVVGKSKIFFISPGRGGVVSGVMAISKDGGPPEVIAEVGGGEAMVGTADELFFTIPDLKVLAVAKAGGTPRTVGEGYATLGRLAADDSAVCWTASEASEASAAGDDTAGAPSVENVMAAFSRQGIYCTARALDPPKRIVEPGGIVSGLRVDSGVVYWTTMGQRGVLGAPVAGGVTTPLIEDRFKVITWTVKDGRAYWISETEGARAVFGKGPGGPPERLDTLSGILQSELVVTPRHIITNSKDGLVKISRTAGASPKTESIDLYGPVGSLTVDGAYLYYANITGIYRSRI